MPAAPVDLSTALHSLGFRASRETISALLTHATKSRLSPVEVGEQLVALERREREARNLARRTRSATLGATQALGNSSFFRGALAGAHSSVT